MAKPASWRPGARAGNPDDGLRLRPVLVRTVAQAPGLSHLHLRLPHRRGRQGVFRARLRLAAKAAERGARPHLQPDQQSRSRNARGPAGDLGRGGGEPRLRLGHGRNLDHALGLRAAGHGRRSFGAGLRRHGLSPDADPAAIRRDDDRVPRRRRGERNGGGDRKGARAWAGRRALSRDAGEPDQRPRRHRPREAPGRGPRRTRGTAASRHRRQHLARARSFRRRSPTAPTWS